MPVTTRSPIDDLTYDLITVLQNKAKALAAYDVYIRDADAEEDESLAELFLAMRSQDEAHVEVLKEALAHRLADELGYEEEEEDEEGGQDEEGNGGDASDDAALLEGEADVDDGSDEDDAVTLEEDEGPALARTERAMRAIHVKEGAVPTTPGAGRAQRGRTAPRR